MVQCMPPPLSLATLHPHPPLHPHPTQPPLCLLLSQYTTFKPHRNSHSAESGDLTLALLSTGQGGQSQFGHTCMEVTCGVADVDCCLFFVSRQHPHLPQLAQVRLLPVNTSTWQSQQTGKISMHQTHTWHKQQLGETSTSENWHLVQSADRWDFFRLTCL